MVLCVLHMGPSLRIFISLFPSVRCHPLLLQRTCIRELNRKWCSSLHESTLGKHHLPLCAKVSVCMKMADLMRSDFLSMRVFGLHSFGSDRRLSSHNRFFRSEDISRISHLYPAACLLGGSRNILPVSLVNVC